jgi:hypothetical protein
MSNSTQCAKLTVVGASGSYIVTAELLVPGGSSLHVRSGMTFPSRAIGCTAERGSVPPYLKRLLATISRAELAVIIRYPPSFIAVPTEEQH